MHSIIPNYASSCVAIDFPSYSKYKMIRTGESPFLPAIALICNMQTAKVCSSPKPNLHLCQVILYKRSMIWLFHRMPYFQFYYYHVVLMLQCWGTLFPPQHFPSFLFLSKKYTNIMDPFSWLFPNVSLHIEFAGLNLGFLHLLYWPAWQSKHISKQW